MPLYGAHRIDRYSATFSPEALITAFGQLGFKLQPADDFVWANAGERMVTVGEPAPVIRATPKASVLQLGLAPWGIRDVRRPIKAGAVFNFPTTADDFRLSARVLVPISAFPGAAQTARETIHFAAGIERSGAWTLLVRERGDDGAVQPIVLPSSRRCKAWLSRGDTGDRNRSL